MSDFLEGYLRVAYLWGKEREETPITYANEFLDLALLHALLQVALL